MRATIGVHTGVIQASLVSSSKFYERFHHQVWNESSERKKWQQWWRERKRFGLSKTTGMAALALHIRKYESSHIEIQI